MATGKLFAELLKFVKKYKPGTQIFSNNLPEFPGGANVGEDCLRKTGRETGPKDYQFTERNGVQSTYRS